MEVKVLSTGIIEPVSVTDCKSFMGYTGSDQDDVIRLLITVAREWLETRTALSVINKQYKAYFEKDDAVNGWYELPFSPVQSTPAITVTVCGTSMTFTQKGLNKVKIKPESYWSTISGTTETYYVEVIFNAGATNETANEIIKRIVSSLFNNREDGIDPSVSVGRLPFDTLRLIETIDQNTGL
jgi:uncharacterized phiE125 gp8 family phage protein